LSLQLGFAIIPLIHFVSDKNKMKGFHIGKATQITSWIIASIIVSLNAKLVFDEIKNWLESSNNAVVLWCTVVPLAIAFLGLLLFIIFEPFIAKVKLEIENHSPHTLTLKIDEYRKYGKKNIAITVDFSLADEGAILSALDLGGIDANYTLIHVVETVGAMMYGNKISDHETLIDEKLLMDYHRMIDEKGFKVTVKLGFGNPGKIISKIVNEGDYHILIMGTHGHTGLKDLVFGTTVDKVRHRIEIPIFLIKN